MLNIEAYNISQRLQAMSYTSLHCLQFWSYQLLYRHCLSLEETPEQLPVQHQQMLASTCCNIAFLWANGIRMRRMAYGFLVANSQHMACRSSSMPIVQSLLLLRNKCSRYTEHSSKISGAHCRHEHAVNRLASQASTRHARVTTVPTSFAKRGA